MLLLVLLCGLFTSCKYDTQIAHPREYVKVFIPAAKESPVIYTLKDLDSTSNSIVFSAYYGGPKYPDANIKVEFIVDVSLVKRYNDNNSTDYLPAPQGSYEVGELSGVIPEGKVSTGFLNLDIQPNELEENSKYMIPLEIVTVDGAKFSNSLSIAYFVINTD